MPRWLQTLGHAILIGGMWAVGTFVKDPHSIGIVQSAIPVLGAILGLFSQAYNTNGTPQSVPGPVNVTPLIGSESTKA